MQCQRRTDNEVLEGLVNEQLNRTQVFKIEHAVRGSGDPWSFGYDKHAMSTKRITSSEFTHDGMTTMSTTDKSSGATRYGRR